MIMERNFKWDEIKHHLLAKGFELIKEVIILEEPHGGAFQRGSNHIDIMKMVTLGDKIVNYGEMGRLVYLYPKELFDEFTDIEFYGVKYKAPKDIDKFLTTRYGNWRTPVSAKEYSYKDPKYSPNVRIL